MIAADVITLSIPDCCNQAFAQACAVYSPFLGSMSAIAIYQQLSASR